MQIPMDSCHIVFALARSKEAFCCSTMTSATCACSNLNLNTYSIKCLLYCATLVKSTDRYLLGEKTKVDLCGVLNSIDVPYEAGKDYLCKTCCRKVEKHAKITENLNKSSKEL